MRTKPGWPLVGYIHLPFFLLLGPANPLHYSIKSRILERLGKHEEAKSCYEKDLKLKNKSAFGHDKESGQDGHSCNIILHIVVSIFFRQSHMN